MHKKHASRLPLCHTLSANKFINSNKFLQHDKLAFNEEEKEDRNPEFYHLKKNKSKAQSSTPQDECIKEMNSQASIFCADNHIL
jgi:hypothetical protein